MTNANGDATKARIINAGIALARDGLHHATGRRIARVAYVDHSAIHYHFGDNAALLNAVAVEAIRRGDAIVIARLILDRHQSVDQMTVQDRQSWLCHADSKLAASA